MTRDEGETMETTLHKSRLLVVDDEPDICEFLSEYFESKGFSTDYALNGPDALEKVDSFRPHIVLLDIRMPGMDGLEVLQRIRDMDSRIGVLMVTGVLDRDIGIRALDLGASDFIVKPINLDYLETSVMAKIMSLLA
jgi:DNA-binding response OmpR family regulator